MQKITTPFEATGKFSKIITAYLKQEDALKPFYHVAPALNQFSALFDVTAQQPIQREKLPEVLLNQYRSIPLHPEVEKNIRSFSDLNTFCVITAHQLNIFTGPLYVIYKTVSAIQLSRTLNQLHPDKHIVPVFWLGSEDHDFEEINHFNVFGKTYTWSDHQGGACGKYDTESIRVLCDELFAVLGEGPNADALRDLFTKAYLNQHDLAFASRMILNSLFEQYGVVVVDGDDIAFKTSCSDIIRQELFERSSEKLVNTTLEHFPFEAQAKPRNINLFYLQPNKRERIIYNEQTQVFEINNSDITFTPAQLETIIEQNPERFSPNVILRPLFQQRVLPSLAYIGGGGEIAYWLQLKSLFENYHIVFPMLLLRDSFMLVDGNTAKKMQKLQLGLNDLFTEESQLIAQYVKSNSSGELDITQEKESLETVFNQLMQKATAIDTSLDKAVLAEKQAVTNAIAKLEAKLLKAEKAKMEVQLTQINGILGKLFPGGGLQERHDNFIPWYLKYGPGFIEMLINQASQPVEGFVSLFPDSE